MEDQQLHQIGSVAERVGLSLRTIRHYEEVGLVHPTGRSTGGFRLYTDADVDRLLQVKAMKPLGFTLEETAAVLELREQLDAGTATPVQAESLEDFIERAEVQCRRLSQQLSDARRLVRDLQEHAAAVPGRPARRPVTSTK